MDTQTLGILTAVVVAILIVCIVAIGVILLFVQRARIVQQEEWEPPKRSDPRSLPGDAVGLRWESGVPNQDILTQRFEQEIQQLDNAGYQWRLVHLPAQDETAYCFTISASLARKASAVNLYLVCKASFPHVSPDAYAEMLSSTSLDQYGQAQSMEIKLRPLETTQKWNMNSSSLLAVVQEILNQLDGEYQFSDKRSVFLNKYGEWIRTLQEQ